MIETIIARRYAKGLSLVAQERGELQTVRKDLDALADLLDTDAGAYSLPELLDFLASPTVRLEDKIRLTDLICEKMGVGKTVSDFLNVLIEKHRVVLTGRMAREYDRIVAQIDAARAVWVESARPLDQAETKAVQEAAVKVAGGVDIQMRTRVNPRLLGGLRIFLDDTLIDTSVAARLEALKAHLL